MNEAMIQQLSDLNRLRDAPNLDADVSIRLQEELQQKMKHADWFTIGVMASSAESAVQALRRLEQYQGWTPHVVAETTDRSGPVFLKANQASGLVRLRVEHGLGEGILITGHKNNSDQPATTWGPLPLNFF
tara:strand:+ start:446 stop:838 length:393 start_codon:yes stop_codon:yes gene_type:complete